MNNKRIRFLSVFFIWSFTFFIMISCSEISKDKNNEVVEEMNVVNEKQLRHVVLFKFKESASAEEIVSVEEAFMALPAKIPEIRSIEWGINNSPEGLNKGFTHGFLLTFDNEEDRAVYLPHPDHIAFGELLTPYLEDVFVLDYWAQK